MRAILAVVLVAATAGCLGEPAQEPQPVAHYRWGLDGCQYVIAVMTLPRERLLPLLPEGFEPRPAQDSLPGAEMGELHADAYNCAKGTALDGGRLGDVDYGSFYVPVDPPAELREPGYEAYFVKLDFILADGLRAPMLKEAGLPVHGGEATVSSPDGVHWSAVLDMSTAGKFVVEGVAGPAQPQEAPLPFIEHSPLTGGGLALWHARLHDATFATGIGTIQLQGPMAEVAGAPSLPVTFSAGTWNLDQADLTFPIAWPA